MENIDIKRLKKALKQAHYLENKLTSAIGEIASIIEESTGIVGYVDYLAGDGFGFTPQSNNDTHVGIDEIIKWAEEGEMITEELILDRKSF